MTADDNSKIPLGSVLVDKYRITREIGRGGMAIVYEAENIDIGKRVAVKVLSADLVTSRVVRERFLREARAAAAIRSPYICDVYDAGEFDGRPFLVMELLEGESLYDRMTHVRRLDVASTLKIATQTAKGLAKAHAAGVVHRDLKPENLFLTRNEEGELVTKLLDFGLAKFYASTDPVDQVRLTREGALFGTPAYMSPEQAKGRGEVDHRSDLWSLACIVYECLTGHTVWNVEQGVAMILAQVATAALPVPSTLRPELPPAFDSWFKKALERSPEDRFQTAAQFAISLTDALAPGDSRHVQTPSLLVDVDDVLQHVAERQESSGSELLTSVPNVNVGSRQPMPPASRRGAVSAVVAGSKQEPRPDSIYPSLRKPFPIVRFLLLLLMAALGSGAYVYRNQLPLSFITARKKPAATDPSASSLPTPNRGVPLEGGGFSDSVLRAQAALAAGNTDDALRQLDDAIKSGGEGIAMNLRGHIRSALETPNAPCRLRAIGRPRPFNVTDSTSRPTILSSGSGAMVVWADAHEDKAKTKRHVFSTLLDSVMRRISDAQLIFPESSNPRYPELFQFGAQRLLLLWDTTTKEPGPGIYSRFIDETGHIDGGLKQLATLARDEYAPALTRDDDGTLWLAWEDDGADGVQNLMARHFDAKLNPLGPAIALTALRSDRALRPSAVRPAIAASHGKLWVLFTLRQGTSRKVHAIHIATNATELAAGLIPSGAIALTENKFLAPIKALGREGTASDDSRIGCTRDTCFAFWGEEAAGIVAAAFDAGSGEQLWRHEIGPRGTRPAVGVDSDQVLVAWFESSRVRVASTDRHGVGGVSTIGKVSGLQPLPAVAKSNEPGQWHLAWRDFESGHFEVVSATVDCRKDDRSKP
jgi:eukaryotic-like serine/threonine-protein kinase